MRTNDVGAVIIFGLVIGLLLGTKFGPPYPAPAPAPESVYGYEDTFPVDVDDMRPMRWPNDHYDSPWCKPWDAPWVCDRWRR